jgi:hypothetical protein
VAMAIFIGWGRPGREVASMGTARVFGARPWPQWPWLDMGVSSDAGVTSEM